MRVDGLTTAKMLAITTALTFRRLLENGGVKRDSEDEKIEEFRKVIKLGLSKAQFIIGLNELGFREAEYFIKKGRGRLEFYNEEHEHYFPDNTREDDGTDSRVEGIIEEGFVGLKQLEAEERAERKEGKKKAAAE